MKTEKDYAQKLEKYIIDFKKKSALYLKSSIQRNKQIYLLHEKEGLSYRKIANIVSTIQPMDWGRVAQIVKAYEKKHPKITN